MKSPLVFLLLLLCVVIDSFSLAHAGDESGCQDSSSLIVKLMSIRDQNIKVNRDGIIKILRSAIGIPDDPQAVDWNERKFAKLTCLLLAAHIVSGQVDEGFDMSNKPTFTVDPPEETGLASGVSPEAIDDPLLRKDYENRIKKNSANAILFKEQVEIRKKRDIILHYTAEYINHYFNKGENEKIFSVIETCAPSMREMLLPYLETAQPLTK